MTKVRVIKDYYDLKLERHLKVNDEVDMTEARAKELSGKENKVGEPLVEIIDASTGEKAAKKPRKKPDNE